MNKISKTILIISIAFLGSFSLIQSTQATQGGLVVRVCETENNSLDCTLLDESQHTSLFDESDFLPGHTINRWVQVTNLSNEIQEIGINVTGHFSACPLSSGVLSDVLTVTIEENANELYQDSLTNFYSAGEEYLSQIQSGAVNVYKFSAFFASESGNEYQGCSANFDFKIGFWGESISSEVNPSGGGGSGGVIMAGLEITQENASLVQDKIATITWLTNKLATSRVIWAAENETRSFDWKNPPDYGYAHSTTEGSTKKTGHSMIVSGLSQNTTYYYRCISHASPDTVSREYSFTTLSSQAPNQEDEQEIVGHTTTKEKTPVKAIETGGIALQDKEVKDNGGGAIEEGEIAKKVEETKDFKADEEESISALNSFLASIGSLVYPKNLYPLILIFVIILIILFLLFLKKRRKKAE